MRASLSVISSCKPQRLRSSGCSRPRPRLGRYSGTRPWKDELVSRRAAASERSSVVPLLSSLDNDSEPDVCSSLRTELPSSAPARALVGTRWLRSQPSSSFSTGSQAAIASCSPLRVATGNRARASTPGLPATAVATAWRRLIS